MKENIIKKKMLFISTLVFAIIFMLSAFLLPSKQNSVYATANFQGNSLVGTTWQIDEVIGEEWNYGDPNFEASITFTSNDTEFSYIYVGDSGNDAYCVRYVEAQAEVFANGEWKDPEDRTIEITGGDDSDSSGSNFETLRAWLNDNAVLISSSGSGSGSGSGADTGVLVDVIVPLTIAIILSGVIATVVIYNNKRAKI